MDPIDLLLGFDFGAGLPLPFYPARVANVNTTASSVRPDRSKSSVIGEISNDLDEGPLLDVEDRRSFNPEKFDPAPRTVTGGRVVIVPRGSSKGGSVPIRVGFANPSSVVICARRMARRQVMMAGGFRGRLGYRHVRRGPFSYISCRGGF